MSSSVGETSHHIATLEERDFPHIQVTYKTLIMAPELYTVLMIRFFQKWGLGWLSAYLYATGGRKHTFIDVLMRRVLGSTSVLSQIDTAFGKEYEAILSQTTYWHGTGMYQYDNQSRIVQAFESILKAGALRPNRDVFDINVGVMESVSCTPIRMYARIYADMHQTGGVSSSTRYGAPYFWGYYFIVSSALVAVHHMKLWTNIVRRKNVGNKVKRDMKKLWISKVRKERFRSLKDFFINGSDITNNFGILIGVKDIDSIQSSSPYIAMYETRSTSPIVINSWSHVEVPQEHVDEIRALFESYSYTVPVYAIEKTERYWSKKPFSSLVR